MINPTTIRSLGAAIFFMASSGVAGLGTDVCLPIGVILALTFVPADTLQAAISRLVNSVGKKNDA